MVDTLYHLVGNLLTNLNTGIVSGLLLVVTSIGTFVQTLDELTHVGSVHTKTVNEIFLQTLSLGHTNSIAH